METVRLTVQLRDHNNRVRVTEHHDVALEDAADRAHTVAANMARYYRQEKRAQQAPAKD